MIKYCEAGAFLLNLIALKYVDRVDFSAFPGIPKETLAGYLQDPTVPKHILFATLLVKILEDRFDRVLDAFIEDPAAYADNLVHGLITTLSLFLTNLRKEPWSTLLSKKEETKHHQQLVKEMIRVIMRVMEFATKVSAQNNSTFILDNDSTKKTIESFNKEGYAVDCRGHVRKETKEPKATKETKEKNAAELFENLAEGSDEFESDSTLVVSFYLMTREGGLLFQTYAHLLAELEKVQKCETSELIICPFEHLG